MTAESLIKLIGIERTFILGDSKVHALRNIHLTIAAGEYISVMGPSGSGKSTLLNMIGLLDVPDAGTYQLDGHEIKSLSHDALASLRSETIGFIFQSFHLISRLSAAANIELPLVLAGISASERANCVSKALKDYGLIDRAEHRPNELSGGQRQRVAIARATILRPAVLLADEPTGNLDSATGEEVVSLLEALNAHGMTLIVVTHDHALGARARRQIRMVDGGIVSDINQADVAPSSSNANYLA